MANRRHSFQDHSERSKSVQKKDEQKSMGPKETFFLYSIIEKKFSERISNTIKAFNYPQLIAQSLRRINCSK